MKLATLIDEEKWPEVLDRIVLHPEEVLSCDIDDFLPLHRACRNEKVPVNVIDALINSYPQSPKEKTTSYGLLPLHYALRVHTSANPDIIRLLLQHNKEAASVIDAYKDTMLHDYIRRSETHSLEVTKILVDAYPVAVHTCNQYNSYPLHRAAYYCTWEISQYLIEVFPDALLIKNSSGSTPLYIASLSCISQLRDKFGEEQHKRFGITDRHASTPSRKVTGESNRNNDGTNDS